MTTRKDLAEACSFSRRRLVTAFLSGASGGREAEPSRPGRTLLAGVALAVVLLASGVVVGLLGAPTTVDWRLEGLVSGKESGADYLVLRTGSGEETELRPLANITSAMLILGPDVAPTRVPDDDLADQVQGAPVGIVGAPALPPQVADLVETGWSACTGGTGRAPAGIRLALLRQPAVRVAPEVSFVVRTTSGLLYLVAESPGGSDRDVESAYAYRVPEGPVTDRILGNVAGTRAAEAVPVPDQWVTLFPPGAPLELETFGLRARDLRAPWAQRDRLPGAEGAEVGDLLQVGDSTYLAVHGGAVPLDEFSSAVYTALAFPEDDPLTTIPLGQGPVGLGDLGRARWPTVARRDRPASGQPCVLTDTRPDARPVVVLATAAAGSPAYAEGDEPGGVDVVVDPGGGAFVQAGDWDLAGPTNPVLVDQRGVAYPVGEGEERRHLGYAGVAEVVVPQDWLGLLHDGVPLTIEAARCPTPRDRVTCPG